MWYIHLCVHVYVHALGGQRSTTASSLQSPPCFETESLAKFTEWLDWLTHRPQGSCCLPLPCAGSLPRFFSHMLGSIPAISCLCSLQTGGKRRSWSTPKLQKLLHTLSFLTGIGPHTTHSALRFATQPRTTLNSFCLFLFCFLRQGFSV